MRILSGSVIPSLAAVALLGTGAPATSADLQSQARASAVRVVTLKNFEVRPPTVRIRRGDEVVWRFRDGVSPHNVISRGRDRFRSSPAKRSGSHRVRFRRAGVYRYLCTIHPHMRGRVIVRR